MYLVFIPKFPLLILLICFVHPLHLCSLYHRQPYHPVILHALPSSFRFLLRPPSSYFLFLFSATSPSFGHLHLLSTPCLQRPVILHLLSSPFYPPPLLLPRSIPVPLLPCVTFSPPLLSSVFWLCGGIVRAVSTSRNALY